MTADPAGWPDPARPGVPLHPERDGWHWLQFEGAPKPFPWCWLPATETDPVAAWGSGDGRELTTAGAAKRWRYLGPCLTPADLAAERAAAAEAMREACLDAAEAERQDWLQIAPPAPVALGCAHVKRRIRALPIPDASALHPDDQAVLTFATEMRTKMAVARAKGRGGWDDPAQCSTAILADLLIGHCAKANAGNFVDIANLAMMLHLRGASTEDASALAERDERMREEGSREAFVKAAEHLRRVALSYDRNGANQAAGAALRGEAEFIEMLAAETRARSEGKG